MAALVIFNVINRRALRRDPVFRDRTDDLDFLNDDQLIARYRFPRQSILDLTDTLRDAIERPSNRSNAIPPHIQVMTTLRILAMGDYLSEVADLHDISIASASRVVHSVCAAICERIQNIKFPREEAEQRRVNEMFYDISSFPNVLGAIDGTLIPIQGMSGDDEPNYVCRKQYHAINVQAICDAELKFTNTVVKWPGATHDAFILANSNIPTIMEGQNGWLLGDSGYGLKKWLMTPLMNPNSQQEIGYNKSHCKTRNTVERAFGVLKARFRCLHKTGESLQFNPPKCCKMIGACFRLHNKACSDGLPVPEDVDIQQLAHHNIINDDQQNNEANAIRRRLIQRF
ncbi:HARBI1 [Mytilus coruscus]|uniref:Putative nuclease HARBI1 n=1 Tax=Mytilus coruscus TaxID=42192 RepID=A0A6J8ARL7_MYTCO|nr:HARBI1 [Mytilus coruscus]